MVIFISRLFICQWCREKDVDENMVKIKVGKQNKRYHRENCYDLYLKDQEFKKKERKELDELVETIKELHGIEIMPRQFFSYLQDVRNGNEFFGRVGQKKQKKGYSYKVIEETYKFCSDSIKWALNNKDFKNSLGMLKYTLAIIRNNIAQVNEVVKRKELQERHTKQYELDQNTNYDLDSFVYKDKKDELDISDML